MKSSYIKLLNLASKVNDKEVRNNIMKLAEEVRRKERNRTTLKFNVLELESLIDSEAEGAGDYEFDKVFVD
tara:strand:- start:416 stop:628 length:213 start_codon:yes stop_codon:yes gene_type:complete